MGCSSSCSGVDNGSPRPLGRHLTRIGQPVADDEDVGSDRVSVRIVSLNDSPLVVEDRSGLRSMTWAPRRCAAIANDNLVRVDGSKNAVVKVAPASSAVTGLPT